MKFGKYLAVSIVCFVFAPNVLFAYEPKYVGAGAGYGIKNPEMAVGYYAKLPGKTARYVLHFEEPGNLYVSLRIPDIPSAGKNVAMQVYYKDQNGESNSLDLAYTEEEWEYYKDDFSGNGYYMGPEVAIEVTSGTHSIVIGSPPDNEKPYVLIIGNKEDESWKSDYRAFKELWKIKNAVYSELPLKAYINFYGIVLAIPIVIIIALTFYGIIKTYLVFRQTDTILNETKSAVQSDVNEVKQDKSDN